MNEQVRAAYGRAIHKAVDAQAIAHEELKRAEEKVRTTRAMVSLVGRLFSNYQAVERMSDSDPRIANLPHYRCSEEKYPGDWNGDYNFVDDPVAMDLLRLKTVLSFRPPYEGPKFKDVCDTVCNLLHNMYRRTMNEETYNMLHERKHPVYTTLKQMNFNVDDALTRNMTFYKVPEC